MHIRKCIIIIHYDFVDNDLDGEALIAAIDRGPETLKEAIPSLGKRLKLIAFLKTTMQVCNVKTYTQSPHYFSTQSDNTRAPDNSNPSSTSSSSSSMTNLVADVRSVTHSFAAYIS